MKKSKIKYYFKKNLISFIVSAIIFSGVGVYAAVTFPSNEVSYDNSSSGLSSSNVKGAIDELYKTCTTPQITKPLDLINDLEKDEYECRYFFTGANPNNYITLNNETAGWRIISVECDGKLKIIKNESIGNQAWSTSALYWAAATLNTYLNGTYYNSLSSSAKSQIIRGEFNVGAEKRYVNGIEDHINLENSSKWSGYIALATVSEILRTNSNKSICNTMLSNDENAEICKSTNWMFNNTNWWTLSANGDNNSLSAIRVLSNQFVGISLISMNNVRPVLYLSSNIKITGGDGSQSNPYTIE